MTEPGILIRCHGCMTGSILPTDQMICPLCGSDFIEVVQTSTPLLPRQRPTNPHAEPGIQSMLSNLLSSIVPGMSGQSSRTSENEQHQQFLRDHQARHQQNMAQAGMAQAPQIPPINELFSQMFNQAPQSNGHGQSNRHFSTHTGPNGSSFSFSFGTSFGTPGATQHFASPPGTAGTNESYPSQHGFPDMSTLLREALGGGPLPQGNSTAAQTFDNLISQLMAENPNSGVEPADDVTMSNLKRVTVSEKDGKVGEECSICQDEYQLGETVIELTCRHFYHDECLLSWLKTNGVCPICRAHVHADPQPVVLEQDDLD